MMRSGNPALTANTFVQMRAHGLQGDVMTLQGTVNKSFILLFCVLITASWVWNKIFAAMQTTPWGMQEAVKPQLPETLPLIIMGGAILGLVFALVTVFKKDWAPLTAPAYALCEGAFLGGVSALFEFSYPGIVMQAVALTFGTLFCLLAAYKSGLIKATENFKLGVVAATGGIFMIYMVTFILGLFGVRVPFIHESGMFGIGFSLFVVVVAALNLVLDFDFIEEGAERGVPKYMEWYGAFGLMVTLIWLYIEILHLLAKLRNR